jgi:hypothetical protein
VQTHPYCSATVRIRGKKRKHLKKIYGARGKFQAVKHLTSKCGDLSSNPNRAKIIFPMLGMVTHTYNLSYEGCRGRKINVEIAKSTGPYLKNN